MTELETSGEHAAPQARAPRRGGRRRWKHLRRSLGLRVVGWLGPFALRRLRRSWKTERLDAQHWDAVGGGKQGVLLALWHGRMVCGMADHEQRSFTVLVSQSRDGDISEKLLKRFGYRVIRGSSSRGGASAARAMLGALEDGAVLIITPDGPRGPRHSTNPGLAWLARETGFPVLPMGFACDQAWRLSSWDRFTIPKYGARVVLTYGAPVRVAKDANDAELERATRAIRERLIAAETLGFRHLKQEPDW